MNRIVFISQVCLLSFICSAQNLKMAQPGFSPGARVGARQLLTTISDGVFKAQQIEDEAQNRKHSFKLLTREKTFHQIQQEKRKRISGLRQEINEVRSQVRTGQQTSLEELESELLKSLCQRVNFEIGNGDIYNPIEDMLSSKATVFEQPISGSYFVPGLWTAPGLEGQGSAQGIVTALRDQDSATVCKVCNNKFGFTRWKYNCYTCGEVVCDDCSSAEIKTEGYVEQKRACRSCVDKYRAFQAARPQSDRILELCAQFETQAKEDRSGNAGTTVAEGILGALNCVVPPPFDLVILAAQKVVSLARTSTVNTAESRRLSNRIARLSFAVIKLSTRSELPLAQRSATDLVSVFDDAVKLLEKFQPDGTRGFMERMRCKWMQYSSDTIRRFNEIHTELTNIMNDRAFALSLEDKNTLAAPTVEEIKEGVRQELNHVVDEVRRVGNETGERLDQIASELQRLQVTLGGGSMRSVILDPRSVRVDTNRVLGQGSFGTVYAGTLYGSIPVAVKEMTNVAGSAFEQLRREVELTMLVADPKVIKVYGLLPSTQSGSHPAIIMERLGDSLESEVVSNPQLSQQLKLKYTLDVIEGMARVHDCKLTHFDLKPGNILLTEDKKRAKIIDFGISQTRSTIRVSGPLGPRGTLQYMAPEMLKGGRCGPACDVYSFGTLLYELWSGQTAWLGRHEDLITSCVEQGARPATREEMEDAGMPESIVALIEACWRQIPAERPTFRQMTEIEDDILESDPERWPEFLRSNGQDTRARSSVAAFQQLSCDALCQFLQSQEIHPDIVNWMREKLYNGKLFIESGARIVERMKANRELDELHVEAFERLQQTILSQHEAKLRRDEAARERHTVEVQRMLFNREDTQRTQLVGEEARAWEEVLHLMTMSAPFPRPTPPSYVSATPAAFEQPQLSFVEHTVRTSAMSARRPRNTLETQNVSALEWELDRKSSQKMTFSEAEAYAASRARAGWRLPTVWELEALYQQRTVLGDDTVETFFWSSTPVANDSHSRWVFHFRKGEAGFDFTKYSYQVRLVRGGQNVGE